MTRSCEMYRKRDGTSGIKGQLYETKLISLLYFRASRAENIEEFQLASNIEHIGAFDDICLKVKVKGHDKPVAVFIQVKHRESKKYPLQYDLGVYFDSYLQIRKSFKTNNEDEFFRGEFEKTECLFVIYTNAMDNINNDPVESSFAAHLQELIGTGGMAKQPHRHQVEVDCLQRTFVKLQITRLAERIAKFISKSNHKDDLQNILRDELVQCYHVILTQTVFDVSDIVPMRVEAKKVCPSHRFASFRHDFFDTNNEYLSLFRDTLVKEILKERKIKASDVKKLLSEFLAEPTDVTKLSKLIGTVVTYNNEKLKLEYLKKNASAKDSMPQLNRVNVFLSTVNEAKLLAAREILLCRQFKVPVAFGNKDLTIRDDMVESRINDLASVIKNVLVKCDANNLVTIDESLGKGFLQLNGGLAGAIGNIFVLHDDTKLMKITNNKETLGDLAKKLYDRFFNEIPNLHKYKFCFNLNKYPKLSFNLSEDENNLAKDFLNKLLLFTNQADENEVGDILKQKIDEYQFDHQNYFQAKTDAMFLKYHDEIQKWWMQPIQAMYLTKDSDVFENAIHNIIEDPLLSSIKVIYMSKIKHFIRYTFTEDAVSFWNLQDNSSTFIITENSEMTVVKVLQYLKNKDHVVLDFEYIVNLPKNDHNALRKELTNKNGKEKVIYVVVCDKTQNLEFNEIKTLEFIANIVLNKNTIIITNSVLVKTLQKHFPRVDNIVYDEKNSLIDMSEESQKSILETTIVMFQGLEVKLNLIIDNKSKVYVKGNILNKIIRNDTIQLSKSIVTRGQLYDEIKHLYVDRWVQKMGSTTNKPLEESPPLKTLYDIKEDVVLVTAEPGMGKSTLLTHLSLGTKIDRPDVWIIRVNLLEYSRELGKWKELETAVDILQTLKFMCQLILREKLGKENYVEIALEEQNGVVYLKHSTGDQLTEFELKLFLHFFSEGKVIFLFDGFDEICPHYANEAIKCIKVVNSYPKKHKIWVTSRSYTHVQTTLQQAFGVPYEIKHFSIETTKEYLNNIWKSNLILKELDRTQWANVYNFLEFMTHSENRELQRFELSLHEIYIHAGVYLVNEIKDSCNSLWTFDRCYNDIYYKEQEAFLFEDDFFDDIKRDRNPLYLLLMAHFFISSIKGDSKTTINWNTDVNTFTFYEQYLETKLKKIRFEVKNKMDIYNPDIRIAYDKERTDFIAKHKKMAAYAIFNQDIDKLFSVNDLREIKETIKCIEEGGEKTGLLCSDVANEIPIFIHMTFAEYFAVEYLYDLLINTNESENQILGLEFIFKVMFSGDDYAELRKIFDYKMKIDKTLLSVIESNKEVLFDLFIKQEIVHSECLGKVRPPNNWPPVRAVFEDLHNCTLFFASIFESYINDSNFEEFLIIVNDTKLLPVAVSSKCKQLAVSVIDIIKKLDISKLNSVLHQNFSYLPCSSEYDSLCAKKIIELIGIAHDNDLERRWQSNMEILTAAGIFFINLLGQILFKSDSN